MSTPAAELEFDAKKLAQYVYIKATSRGELQIICNWCTEAGYIFYEGDDFKASLKGSDWLAKAVQHLLENHPDKA